MTFRAQLLWQWQAEHSLKNSMDKTKGPFSILHEMHYTAPIKCTSSFAPQGRNRVQNSFFAIFLCFAVSSAFHIQFKWLDILEIFSRWLLMLTNFLNGFITFSTCCSDSLLNLLWTTAVVPLSGNLSSSRESYLTSVALRGGWWGNWFGKSVMEVWHPT